MVKKFNLKQAKLEAKRLKFPLNKDYFALTSTENSMLMGLLKMTSYSYTGPKSKSRAFWDSLSR